MPEIRSVVNTSLRDGHVLVYDKIKVNTPLVNFEAFTCLKKLLPIAFTLQKS